MTLPRRSAGKEDPPKGRSSSVGVVTFLDVLGWKGIYNREREPISRLHSLLDDLLRITESQRGRAPSQIEVRSISDTIVLFSAVSEREAQGALAAHGEVCATAIVRSIASRIPVRGATAFGSFEFSESVYVGKAIDEAAAWYEEGQWIGVHLTPSAEYLLPDEAPRFWIPYPPPLKQRAKYQTHCVDWLDLWMTSSGDDRTLSKLKTLFREMGPIVPGVAEKFENTLLFLNALLAQMRTVSSISEVSVPEEE